MTISVLTFALVILVSAMIGAEIGRRISDWILMRYYVANNKIGVYAKFDVDKRTAYVRIRGDLSGSIRQMENLVNALEWYRDDEFDPEPNPEEDAYYAGNVWPLWKIISDLDPGIDGEGGSYTTAAKSIMWSRKKHYITDSEAAEELQALIDRMNEEVDG